jgi:hypothetical protein
MTLPTSDQTAAPRLETLAARFDEALARLESAKPFAKANHRGRFLDQARRLLATPGGVHHVYAAAPRYDAAGVFLGSDWERPEFLNPNLVSQTFESRESHLITLECVSELRILAIAKGFYFSPNLSEAQAVRFLTKVLALNLHVLFGTTDEAARALPPAMNAVLKNQLDFIAEHIGFESILDEVISEVWRILRQRPVQTDSVKVMIGRIAQCLHTPEIELRTTARGADTLVSALFGPTDASREDPGLDAYLTRVRAMHSQTLNEEALAFARAMHDTGLVSPYHAGLVRELLTLDPDLVPVALGLSSTGRDVFYCYRELILTLIEMCVYHDTSQAVYGLSALLERAVLYLPGVAPSLWRQTVAPLSPDVQTAIRKVYGDAHPPHVYLMLGVLTVLGQPLGLGQGNNPVCQSTRAISMWSYSDPDYLLQLVRWAARDNNISMTFEGRVLDSASIPDATGGRWYLDLDPLSLVLVPHLDRIYEEIARLCAARDEDYHKWINPEFHGWRVHRGFAIAVDVRTGAPKDLRDFVSRFYTLYHPYHNNNIPVVHPQPAGIAFTDSQARFVGWHAITILRVGLDHENTMRVYFFNPNNDSGQDWGHGVVVSTHGRGERPGESSLPFDQFTSRLYIFHYDASDYYGPAPTLSGEEIARVVDMATTSWVPGLTSSREA